MSNFYLKSVVYKHVFIPLFNILNIFVSKKKEVTEGTSLSKSLMFYTPRKFAKNSSAKM
jgi:hypothetical protein